MRPLSITAQFITSARFGGATCKALAKDRPFLATIASTPILNLIVPIVLNATKNRNEIESFASQINHFHSIHYNNLPLDCQGGII